MTISKKKARKFCPNHHHKLFSCEFITFFLEIIWPFKKQIPKTSQAKKLKSLACSGDTCSGERSCVRMYWSLQVIRRSELCPEKTTARSWLAMSFSHNSLSLMCPPLCYTNSYYKTPRPCVIKNSKFFSTLQWRSAAKFLAPTESETDRRSSFSPGASCLFLLRNFLHQQKSKLTDDHRFPPAPVFSSYCGNFPLSVHKQEIRVSSIIRVFSFSLLWGNWNGDHPEEELAKIWLQVREKVEFFWKPAAVFVLFSILWCCHFGDHRQGCLPMFGYTSYETRNLLKILLYPRYLPEQCVETCWFL